MSVGSAGLQANAPSEAPTISSDGRLVAFTSHATNLVPGDTNAEPDVFVRDLQTGSTERISVGTDGAQGTGMSEAASISLDGRYVAFASTAGNLVSTAQGADTNRAWDVFVHDRLEGTTWRISVASSVGQGDGHSWMPSISSDGRFVAFSSRAGNLVAEDTNGQADVFVHDRETSTTVRISIASGGFQGNGSSTAPAISGDGRFVAFCSSAGNLVPGDTNNSPDVFVHDRQAGATTRASVGVLSQAVGISLWPAISRDGRFVAFPDSAADLAPGDTNSRLDVFVRGPL